MGNKTDRQQSLDLQHWSREITVERDMKGGRRGKKDRK